MGRREPTLGLNGKGTTIIAASEAAMILSLHPQLLIVAGRDGRDGKEAFGLRIPGCNLSNPPFKLFVYFSTSPGIQVSIALGVIGLVYALLDRTPDMVYSYQTVHATDNPPPSCEYYW